ncbi:hypothetical protein C8R48DRAFT_587415 [Suillus tomentosus]|nr:hypothetical protein C8R48DRAFT_587415 [Suillus tomentosus]
MPKEIEKTLTNRARNFIWDNKGKSQVSLDILCAPIDEGGKNMMHLTHRNDAIELMWLKGLLKPEQERPPWAFFANALIAKYVKPAPTVHPTVKINLFLQSWKPLTRKLPPSLQRIIKAAKTYHVKWDACIIPPQVARQLPIWFHIGANQNLNKLNNYYYANCLRDKHNVRTVGDIEAITSPMPQGHLNKKECECDRCNKERTQYNCNKPYRCRKTAIDILHCILPKWNPSTEV